MRDVRDERRLELGQLELADGVAEAEQGRGQDREPHERDERDLERQEIAGPHRRGVRRRAHAHREALERAAHRLGAGGCVGPGLAHVADPLLLRVEQLDREVARVLDPAVEPRVLRHSLVVHHVEMVPQEHRGTDPPSAGADHLPGGPAQQHAREVLTAPRPLAGRVDHRLALHDQQRDAVQVVERHEVRALELARPVRQRGLDHDPRGALAGRVLGRRNCAPQVIEQLLLERLRDLLPDVAVVAARVGLDRARDAQRQVDAGAGQQGGRDRDPEGGGEQRAAAKA